MQLTRNRCHIRAVVGQEVELIRYLATYISATRMISCG